jgi:hypothetical protein
VEEEMYLLAEFQRAGDAKIAPGFMFDVAQRAANVLLTI